MPISQGPPSDVAATPVMEHQAEPTEQQLPVQILSAAARLGTGSVLSHLHVPTASHSPGAAPRLPVHTGASPRLPTARCLQVSRSLPTVLPAPGPHATLSHHVPLLLWVAPSSPRAAAHAAWRRWGRGRGGPHSALGSSLSPGVWTAGAEVHAARTVGSSAQPASRRLLHSWRISVPPAPHTPKAVQCTFCAHPGKDESLHCP